MFNFLKRRKKVASLENKSSQQKPNYKLINQFEFKNSHGFRGYKRIALVIYNDQQCEEDIPKVIRDSDGEIGNVCIVLKYIVGSGWKGIAVYADGKKIGTFYGREDDDKYYLFDGIINNKVDSVHIRIEDTNCVLSIDDDGHLIPSVRPRVFLFVHLVDSNFEEASTQKDEK